MAKALPSGSVVLDPPSLHEAVTPWVLCAWMYKAARATHPRRSLADLAQRARLFFGQLARRHELRRWHHAVAPPLRDMLVWRPSLVAIVRRPYISVGWSPARRIVAVEEHYRQLIGRGHALRVRPDEALHLASVSGRGPGVDIVLDSPAWFLHEGELCLNLFHGGERIYTLAFSLGFDAGEAVAYVGALQGSGSDGALDLYRTLTASFHGLRPRDLLIAAFRIVCQALGLARWLAVSDASRVSCSPYFGAARAVRSSYDAAWSEHGGSLHPDGFYRMPVALERRSHDATPSRKRSSYRRRYAMLDQLAAEVTQAMRNRSEP